jgi:hypothetical protein
MLKIYAVAIVVVVVVVVVIVVVSFLGWTNLHTQLLNLCKVCQIKLKCFLPSSCI